MIDLILSGTPAGSDGLVYVPGISARPVLGAINEVVSFHLRAREVGGYNHEEVTYAAPADCEVSSDGETYGATATYAIGDIDDVNTAELHVKRTAQSDLTTPRQSVFSPRLAEAQTTPWWSGFSGGWAESDASNRLTVVSDTRVEIDSSALLNDMCQYKRIVAMSEAAHGVVSFDLVQPVDSTLYSRVYLSLSDDATPNISSTYLVIAQLYGSSHATLAGRLQLRYYDNNGVAQYFNGVDWGTTAVYLPYGAGQHLYANGDRASISITFDQDTDEMKISATHVGNAYTTDCDAVTLDYIRGTGSANFWAYVVDNSGSVAFKTIAENPAYAAAP